MTKAIKSNTKLKKKEPTNNQAEFYGSAVVGAKGQIVIPQNAREKFKINPGDKMVVFANEAGLLAIIKSEELSTFLKKIGFPITV